MKVYLFRHGQKDNLPYSDPDLTAFGHQQAQKIQREIQQGGLLAGTHFIASPRIRAQNTLRPATVFCAQSLAVASDLDQREPFESSDDFRARVQLFINGLSKKYAVNDVVYLCTHHDWIEEALNCIPADVDLLDMRYCHWAAAQFMFFEVKKGIWHLQKHDPDFTMSTAIRNIWAIGRNYADHAKELGNELPQEPLIFLKAGSTAVIGKHHFTLPAWSEEVHHEVELALRFDDRLQATSAAVALDLTERQLQNQLKAKGSPWTLAKSFSQSCPVSDFFAVSSLQELSALDLRFSVNGEVRQQGNTRQMIFSLQRQIEFVRKHFPVVSGDLLLTGTPAGVGPLRRGDQVVAEIVGKVRAQWRVE